MTLADGRSVFAPPPLAIAHQLGSIEQALKADNIKVVTLCGGVPLRAQTASLENGAHIAVGTPGRIMDHLERGSLNIEALNTLVLDEADRMLDMGFAEDIAQVFLGTRIQCAQCHNHPFDRWTQDDYYGFAAFFSQIGRKQTDDPAEVIVYNSKGGESRHFLTQAVMKPKFLGGDTPELKPGDDRRKVLADWMASPRNPYFARNIANITWAHFNGTGNIGVLLGEPSGWLIDVDLDCDEAVALAPKFLPPTGATSGRPGKPASHWWYVC